jgi:hypothetical protein
MSYAEQVAFAANVAQILGAIGTVGGIFYAAAQLKNNASTSQSALLLQLEDMSHDHDAVRAKMSPGGAWTEKGAGPTTPKEWMQVEDYLRFFEHCEILIRQGSLNPRLFWRLFGHRLENILGHESIVRRKLIEERDYRRLFWGLLRRYNLMHRVPISHPSNDEAAASTHQGALATR